MQEYQNLVKSGESADLGTAIQNLINDNLRFINTALFQDFVQKRVLLIILMSLLKKK